MFGQKYGYRPFPVSIATQEYQDLRAELKAMGRDVTLLSQWFQRDENVVPAVYSLVPISSRLPNYVNSVSKPFLTCYLFLYFLQVKSLAMKS